MSGSTPSEQKPELRPPPSPTARWPAALVCLATLCALLFAYGPLIASDPILRRDDETLLRGVRGLSSPLAWPEAVRTGRILDVQPVRDLALGVGLRASALSGHGLFHAFNLLLWICICVLAWRLFARTAGERLALFALPLFALHPIFAGSVGWISASKHLLAAAFLLGAALLLLRAIDERNAAPRSALAFCALYALAMLSQPIGLLFPLWAALAVMLLSPAPSRRALLRWPAVLLPLFALAGFINAAYYTRLYPQLAASKLVEASAGERLLSLGRTAFNLLSPIALSPIYSPGSVWNLVGLFALLLLAWLLLRRSSREVWLAFAFASFPLALVTLRMTNIFVSDTYALLPAVGIFSALLARLRDAGPRAMRIGGVTLLALSLPAAALTARQARTWRSDAALWEHAAEVEPCPQTLVRFGGELLRLGELRQAREVAEGLIASGESEPQLAFLYSRAVAQDPSLLLADKIERLEAAPLDDPWRDYLLGTLHAQSGDAGRGADLLVRALRSPLAFKGELPVIAAEATALCQLASRSPCVDLAALRTLPGWSEEAYARRRSSLARTR